MDVARWLMLLCLWPACAAAQGPSLFLSGARAPLVTPSPERRAAPDGSLFIGQNAAGLFAPWGKRAPPPEPRPDRGVVPPARELGPAPAPASATVARLRDLIAMAEAGAAGYDAVQRGARIRPDKPPTQMRIGEIRAWVAATPGQPHAIGRYQFIPSTFNTLVTRLGYGDTALFTAAVQDRMADLLLSGAGLPHFQRGEIGRVAFMNNLAKIWAGLPTSSGLSHYDGVAGNKAVISWTRFEAEMRRIFPPGPA